MQSDRPSTRSQYRDSSNLNARQQLHARFSVNQHGWHRWVFDQLVVPFAARIVELGCGPGALWVENLNRVPLDWRVTLVDLSPGMLYEARAHCPDTDLTLADAQSIPFDDGSFDAQSDHVVWGLRPIIDGQLQLVYSPFLAEAIEGLANAPETLMSSSEAGDFWTPRDGSRSVLAAVEAYPDLPAIVLGTEEDHALGIEDHAHISGLAGALLASGAPWVRVNPDEAYVALTSGQELSWSDNQANLQLEPGDEGVSMLPEEDDLNLDPRVYTTAALVELSHRAWTASWQDDLEWVLME